MSIHEREIGMDIPEDLVNEVTTHITDLLMLNEHCDEYAREMMGAQDYPQNLEQWNPDKILLYWELYANRTKEVIIKALSEL